MKPAPSAPSNFVPANDNCRARIEYAADGSIIRVVPAQTSNPLMCRPYKARPAAATEHPSMAALRTQIALRQAVGSGWDGRRVSGWPTAERLLRHQRIDDLRRLYSWRALVDLATLEPANDNVADPAPAQGEDDDRPAEEVIDQADSLMVMRPSVGDIMAAVQWRTNDRPSIVVVDPVSGSLRKQLGGLTFGADNQLISFRREPDGRLHQSKPEVLYRRRAERKPPPHPISSSSLWTSQTHIEARSELRHLSAQLGDQHCEVLELACGPSTAKSIGETLDKVGKAAERAGIQAVDEALQALASLKRA